jgi:hypothetical protein
MTQVLRDLSMDRFYRVREGDAQANPWPLRSFRLAATPGARGPQAGHAH